MNKPRVLGVGILGIGGAVVSMLPAIGRSPHFRVAAACDIDADVLGRFGKDYPDAGLFSDLNAFCSDPHIDLVYIATPTLLHRDHACAALRAGKHVLIEKPMAVTLEEADEMIAAAERAGVLLGVNVKHSFEPRIQALRGFVRSGAFGRLRMLQSWRYVDWLYQPRTEEELAPGWGSGLLWRQGPHQFDLLRTIGGGLVRSIRGSTLNLDPKRGVDGAYTAFLEFEDGTACSAMCSGYDHFDSRHLVGGFDGKSPLAEPGRHARARAKLAAHDPAWEEAQAAGERYGGGTGGDGGNSSGWLVRGPLVVSFEGADVRFSRLGLIVDGDDAQREIDLSASGDGRDGRLVTFYRSIAEGRPLPADGKWGKATQEVLVAMEQSSAARAEMRLEHQTAYVDQDG